MAGAAGQGEVRCRISDEDLVEGYLRPKVTGEATATPRFIVDDMEEELYTREPWLLPQPTDPILNPREFFYFRKRNWKYREAEGVECEGSWLQIQSGSAIMSEESGEVIGASRRFKYYFRNKSDKVSRMEKRNWFMREYRIYDKDMRPYRSRLVLCKITCNII